MERIRITNLVPGQVFPHQVFSVTGQKLLNAGVPLNERHIRAMRQFGDLDVYVADSVEELVEAGIIERFDNSKLHVGEKLTHSLITHTGQMVLEPGQEIEEHHLDALRADGHTFTTRASLGQHRERILIADALVEELDAQVRGLNLRVAPEAAAWVQPRDSAAWPDVAQLVTIRNAAVEKLRDTFARLEAGLAVSSKTFDPILDDLLSRLTSHPARFTQLALLCPGRHDYLPDHNYTTTVLAMAIAAQLHWPKEAVRVLGLAGLLFDLGMLMIPERIRTGACELTDVDRSRVNRHPVFALAILQPVTDVPALVKLAALQHHERENGSGYPRGLRKDHICDYARVLAVADAFAATTEPRHYRRPKLPYIAMEEMVRSASTMSFWKPVARALVQAAGLFPVGSYVKLSDGANAHVIAAHSQRLDRPVVQPLDLLGQPKGNAIDLAQTPPAQLNIVRPIPSALG